MPNLPNATLGVHGGPASAETLGVCPERLKQGALAGRARGREQILHGQPIGQTQAGITATKAAPLTLSTNLCSHFVTIYCHR